MQEDSRGEWPMPVLSTSALALGTLRCELSLPQGRVQELAPQTPETQSMQRGFGVCPACIFPWYLENKGCLLRYNLELEALISINCHAYIAVANCWGGL